MPDRDLTIPSYYLTRDTPDGTRYLYPIQAIAEAAGELWERPWGEAGPHGRRGWTFDVVEPDGVAWRFADPWLVTDTPLTELRRTRPGPTQDDGLIKRDEPHAGYEEPVSPDLRAAFDAAPERPDPADVEHYREHGAAHVCWRCRVHTATYVIRRVPGPDVVETQRFDGWQELPGSEDPDPGREWIVDDPGHLTLFGRHTGHLWPGCLTGLRAAVVDALQVHPFVAGIRGPYEHERHKMSVDIRVPFDPPRTVDRRVKETPRSRTRPRLVTDKVFGINTSVSDVVVPDRLSAATKADALAAWDGVLNAQVNRIVPALPTMRVCGACDGLGVTGGTQ